MIQPNPMFERGRLLYQTGRTAEAEEAFRRVILDDPSFAGAYAMLALCLAQTKRVREALSEAQQAVSLEPYNPFCHHAMAICQFEGREYSEALQSIEQALRLGPEVTQLHILHAQALLKLKRVSDARTACQTALAINPECEDALYLLSMIEQQTGNRESAEELAKAAVRAAPEDATAHIARGYSHAHAGRPKEAFESFREALRLDPNSESAREGLILSLKLNHAFYRGMFNCFVWTSRLSAKAQWAVLIGLILVQNVAFRVAKEVPILAPLAIPLLIACLAFCLFSWIADPLAYSLLLLNRWGRLALSAREKAVAGIFLFCLFGGIGAGITGVCLEDPRLTIGGIGLLAILIPATRAVSADKSAARYTAVGFSALIAVILFRCRRPRRDRRPVHRRSGADRVPVRLQCGDDTGERDVTWESMIDGGK